MGNEQGGQFGRYQLQTRIGRGGMAETWRAQLKGAAGVTKPVLIKKVLPEYADDEAFTSMFISEARISATLSHGAIAQVFDFGEVNGEYFLAMEFVDGQPLHRVMKRALRSGYASLPVPIATYIALEMGRGLHYAHTRVDDAGTPLGIVHRDISPDNVLISYEGQVKIVDFGIAKARSLRSFDTAPGVVKGKYLFFSPEQARGEEVDARTDVWATGVVLFEMLCGRLPLEGPEYVVMHKLHHRAALPRARDLKPDLPARLDAILQKALALNKEERFESAHAFADALAGFLYKAAPRFSAMSAGFLLRELFREDLRELGRDTKVPSSFVEELSVWRATTNLPRPTEVLPQLDEKPRTRQAETLGAPGEEGAVEEEEGDEGGNSPDRGGFIERGGLRFSLHHAVVAGGLLVLGWMLWSSFSKLKPDWVPREQGEATARPRPPMGKPPVEGQGPGGSRAPTVGASAAKPAEPAPERSASAAMPVELVQLEARRDVFKVSEGLAGMASLDPRASYRIQELPVTVASERNKPQPQLFYLFTGPDFSADVSLGLLSRRGEAFQGATGVLFFTVGAETTKVDLPERTVTVTHGLTKEVRRITVHPERMTTQVDRAFLIQGMDPAEEYFLSVENVGDGAFTRGRAHGPVGTVACLQEMPVTREGSYLGPEKAQRFLLHRGRPPFRVTGLQGLRCGFVDNDLSDNEGAMTLHIETKRTRTAAAKPAPSAAAPQAAPEEPKPPPTRGDLALEQARQLSRANQLEAARVRLRECVAMEPHHFECHLLLGKTAARLGRLAEGAEHYQLFLDTLPPGFIHPQAGEVIRELSKYKYEQELRSHDVP